MKLAGIQLVKSSEEFFYGYINETINKRCFPLSSEAEFYLVNLLSRYTKSANLYELNENGNWEDVPLAFRLKKAEDEQLTLNKRVLFREVGDVALFTVGLFPTKNVSSPYYSSIGKTGYSNAAKYYSERAMKDLYRELAGNFERITFMLRGVCKPESARW